MYDPGGFDPCLESAPKPSPFATPLVVLWAGIIFGLCEATFGLSLGWHHQLLYFALILGFTAALSLVLGATLTLVRAPIPLALVLWACAFAGISETWSFAVALAFVGVACLKIPCVSRAAPGFLSACAGTGLVFALLRGAGLADLAGLGGLPVRAGEAIATALLFATAFVGAPATFSTCVPRLSPHLASVAVVLFGLGFSAMPILEAPNGLKRLPPPGYASDTEEHASPHVFLLVLDTVRADHMSIYGSDRDTTPELDRWVQGRDNVAVYSQAYANGTWTVPSHATLFTGLLPNEHGAHFALDGSLSYRFGLDEETPTLAQGLQAAGYATLGSFSNNWLRTVVGMGRGFDRYFLSPNFEPLPFVGEKLRMWLVPGLAAEAAKGGARACAVNRTLLSMVDPWSEGVKPLFVFGNYGDAHGPYAPPPGFRGHFRDAHLRERPEHLSVEQTPSELAILEARYDEEILYLDSELGRFFDELNQRGIFDDSWIIVTADHGEAFNEHGLLEHGTTVHNEVSRIPLVIFPPKGESLPRTAGPVSLVDVAKTIAGIGGFEIDGPGRDLRLPQSGEHGVAIEFYGDASKARRHGAKARYASRAVLLNQYKLIEWGHDYFLHDLDRDPGEMMNLVESLPHIAEKMKSMLPRRGEPNRIEDGGGPAQGALKTLRGLGYVGGEP